MEKKELESLLLLQHSNYIKSIQSLRDNQLLTANPRKWNAVQLLDHIVRSVSPVSTAFALPAFLLRLVFGTANRKSRSYEELVARYHDKLKAGGRASGRFVPPPKTDSVEKLSATLTKIVQVLAKRIDRFTETQPNLLLLPHPLLGKLTLREMLYFTIYHVQHHQKQPTA
ncbi:MAG: DinB family protein [Cyclobacteriaceae bacterium]|nr:DinB family protein [Cyclobacteriaceae bacterium]